MTRERAWHLLDVLGRGGFGTVYRASEVGPGGFRRTVAVKALNPEGADVAEFGARLRDEARLLGLLRHRAIVHVDGLLPLQAGGWAVVMEYIPGATLGELVERHGRVPTRAALEVVAEVASALHAALHTRAPDNSSLMVQHRDVKPSNVLVTPAGEVKLLDFGIARATFEGREAETRSMAFGSIEYMSPERLVLAGGAPADVYALGVVLVELLTAGRFGRASVGEGKHRERVARVAEQITDWTGLDGLGELVRQMLSFEEGDRPTARDVERRCAELARLAGDASVSEWAEGAVPEVLQLREPTLDARCGRPLAVAATRAGVTRPRRARTLWVSLGVGAVLAAAGATAALGLVYARGVAPMTRELPNVVRVDPPKPELPVHVEAPPQPTSGERDRTVRSAPQGERRRTSELTSTPEPMPIERPPPPSSALGSVTVAGDAVSVTLRSTSGAHVAPGTRVPPGHYVLVVQFEADSEPVQAIREVVVEPGGHIRFTCSAQFRRCIEP